MDYTNEQIMAIAENMYLEGIKTFEIIRVTASIGGLPVAWETFIKKMRKKGYAIRNQHETYYSQFEIERRRKISKQLREIDSQLEQLHHERYRLASEIDDPDVDTDYIGYPIEKFLQS